MVAPTLLRQYMDYLAQEREEHSTHSQYLIFISSSAQNAPFHFNK